MPRLTHTNRSGQAIVLFTLSIPVMFMLIGFAVDTGWAYYRQQAAHTAAEAAALAAVEAAGGTYTCASGSPTVVCQGATACPSSISGPTSNFNIACLYARSNGFTSGGNQNVMVAANATSTPPTVSGVNTSYWVTVTVAETVPQTFSAVLGKPATTVSARATAGAFPNGGGGCIYVMAPSGSGVNMSGFASIQSGCGIYVNSNSSAAVLLSGSPIITATNGSSIDIVGNVTKSGSPTISPAPTIGAPAEADPLASMNPPSGWSSYPNCIVSGPLVSSSATSTTISPPTPGGNCLVNSGITMSGSASVSFAAGFYVLKGGINTSGTSSVSGSGVTFYTPTAGITMSGTGGINITAPASGPWEGIAMFQDRSNSSSDTLSGGTTQQINGVIYMPNGALTYSGGSGVSGTTTTLVVKNVTFSGSSYIKDAATTQYGGGGGSGIALLE
ncbi:MAG TPA: TadE family protein [Bryobacteraceae bacterium]|nr:TadE family protein [Bryobacteraceae bacterium]